MTLNLRMVRLFLAVAEELHFSAAAKRMNVAQPALSRAIRSLEKELGTDLFRRSTRSVELTRAGHLFRREAQAAVDHLDAAIQGVRKIARGEAGSLSIGYMDFAVEGVFPEILKEYRRRHAAVTVEAKASFTDRIIDDLLTERVDIGFVVGPVDHAAITSLTVQRDRYVVVVPEAHHLASRNSVPLSELAGEPLVLGRRERWGPYIRLIEGLCAGAGFAPRVTQEADTTESIFAFVASGIGSTIYVDRAFKYQPPGVRILPLSDVDANVTTEVVWRTGDQDALVSNFVSICRTFKTAS